MGMRNHRKLHADVAAADDVARGTVSLALAELRALPEQISRAAGLPAAYLRNYLERGSPTVLPGVVRRRLAAHLGVPEQALR